jgi:hypothetical protein
MIGRGLPSQNFFLDTPGWIGKISAPALRDFNAGALFWKRLKHFQWNYSYNNPPGRDEPGCLLWLEFY